MHFNRGGNVSNRIREKISKATFFSRDFNVMGGKERQLLGEDINTKVSCAFLDWNDLE